MTNQPHGPEGSTQIPVQAINTGSDVLEVVRHDDLRVVHTPDRKIWTPDGTVKAPEIADKVSDDWNKFTGEIAVRHS